METRHDVNWPSKVTAGIKSIDLATVTNREPKGTNPHIMKIAPPETIDFPDTERCVENLRRMAELCVRAMLRLLSGV